MTDVFGWMASQVVAVTTAGTVAVEQDTLQRLVLRELHGRGPVTAYELADAMRLPVPVTRNALYRLLRAAEVRVVGLVPAPRGVARRCVWAPRRRHG